MHSRWILSWQEGKIAKKESENDATKNIKSKFHLALPGDRRGREL